MRKEDYSYRKAPWHKGLILLPAGLQLFLLFTNIQELQNMPREIFSRQAWESYVISQHFRIVLNTILSVSFLWMFFVGVWAKTKKQAEKNRCHISFDPPSRLADHRIWVPFCLTQ